jgi:hypothetical protein
MSIELPFSDLVRHRNELRKSLRPLAGGVSNRISVHHISNDPRHVLVASDGFSSPAQSFQVGFKTCVTGIVGAYYEVWTVDEESTSCRLEEVCLHLMQVDDPRSPVKELIQVHCEPGFSQSGNARGVRQVSYKRGPHMHIKDSKALKKCHFFLDGCSTSGALESIESFRRAVKQTSQMLIDELEGYFEP